MALADAQRLTTVHLVPAHKDCVTLVTFSYECFSIAGTLKPHQRGPCASGYSVKGRDWTLISDELGIRTCCKCRCLKQLSTRDFFNVDGQHVVQTHSDRNEEWKHAVRLWQVLRILNRMYDAWRLMNWDATNVSFLATFMCLSPCLGKVDPHICSLTHSVCRLWICVQTPSWHVAFCQQLNRPLKG